MANIKIRQTHPQASPQATITTSTDTSRDDDDSDNTHSTLLKLHEFANAKGDISYLLDDTVVSKIGVDAVNQWRIDESSRSTWMETAERALNIAAQESEEGGDGEKDYPFENSSDVHYPILTTASQQFAARAYPALVRGDKVVGVKVFQPPTQKPSVQDEAQAGPQPTNNQEAIQATTELAAAKIKEQQEALEGQAKVARAERVKHYLNWQIFYKMANWEGETDQLLHEAPIVGAGFKRIYYNSGLQSDYISATRLTVNNNAKSIYRTPRITWDFDAYPYEIEQKQRDTVYRDFEFPQLGDDPQSPRLLIEQNRLEDLDDDGYLEPYIVTVDVNTHQTLRIEPAYTEDDITINEETGEVVRIIPWLGYSEFFFLPDPKGRYYGIGFGRLLEAISDSIDTGINQLIDAGNAQIAGGGFVAGGVRLQGSGQGGTIYQRPGEYQTVSAPGGNLREAIWERTLPNPSQITMQLVELLLGAAKDIASIKDVITGNTPATAPVGTTLALQDQALQVFTAIYQRMYRGFHHEFYLMYKAMKRWGTAKDKLEYKELTGGDFDEDFAGDGTDIQPVADPAVVTKQQKIARIQTLMQLAESPVGMAAGMTQAGPSQEIVKEALNAMDWDRPERFLAAVPPNPEALAKTADMNAAANLKNAQAGSEASESKLDEAKSLHEIGLAVGELHKHVRQLAGMPEDNPSALDAITHSNNLQTNALEANQQQIDHSLGQQQIEQQAQQAQQPEAA